MGASEIQGGPRRPSEPEVIEAIAELLLEHTVGPKPKRGYQFYPAWSTLPEAHKQVWREHVRRSILPEFRAEVEALIGQLPQPHLHEPPTQA